MFFVIYFAVIAFALYFIFHDRFGEEGRRKRMSSDKPTNVYHPEPQTRIPQVSESHETQTVKPVQARPAVPTYVGTKRDERELSWSYLYKLEYDETLVGEVMEMEVTGMRHYCTLADLGPVNGIIQPEPENPKDPQAQAVIRSDGKKIGYIARNNLPQYQFFNPTNAVCPFAGHVKVTRQGYIWAEILVVLPLDHDFVKDELSAYMNADPNES